MSDIARSGILFSLLDHETDVEMVCHIHDTLNSIMHAMAADNLSAWLALCREVLTVRDQTLLRIFRPEQTNLSCQAQAG